MKILFACSAVMLALATGCATHHFDETLVAPTPLTSVGTKLSLLPSAVQHAILACGGTAEIKDISKTVMDQDIYRVQFSNPAGNPTVYIMEDGTLMGGGKAAASVGATATTATTSTTTTILPPPVATVLEQQAPHAVISHVATTPLTSYEITFADTNTHPNMVILQDGTVLKP